MPVVFDCNAELPIATFGELPDGPINAFNVWLPMAMSKLEVVELSNASGPIATLEPPDVFSANELLPTATLLFPDVLRSNEEVPALSRPGRRTLC